MRRKGQKRAPVKGQPQKHLRPPSEAFGKGVDRNRQQRQHAKRNGRAVECQQDGQADQRLRRHPDGGLFGADLP